MEDKEAIVVLMSLLKKKLLNAEEKKAVLAAIGVLSWTALAESRRKAQKAKRDKNIQWRKNT